MSKRGQVLDTSGHGYQMLFRDAARAMTTAWHRKYGAVECPALSHALSLCAEGIWEMVESDGGTTVGFVLNGCAVLAEDMPAEPHIDAPETASEASVEELGADIPPHIYPANKRRSKQVESKATVTYKRRRI